MNPLSAGVCHAPEERPVRTSEPPISAGASASEERQATHTWLMSRITDLPVYVVLREPDAERDIYDASWRESQLTNSFPLSAMKAKAAATPAVTCPRLMCRAYLSGVKVNCRSKTAVSLILSAGGARGESYPPTPI